ncbi:RNA polymerase sigma factor [Nonomuraea sp. NPDC050643]|uniref:RNA polymerase sigma factor n=1 Tax=Nonomuraea sp. NPDC050643 TaxID=3155660 RepID=UPI0033C39900
MALPSDLTDPPDLRADWEEIFTTHFAGIHRYIARRLSEDIADDLAAEVFLAAYRGGYDASRGEVRPWLYGIATHLVARHHRTEVRKWKALSRAAERLEHSHEDATLTRVAAGELTGRLAGALAGLNRRDRDVVLLSALGGHWQADPGRQSFEQFLSRTSALLGMPVSPAVRAAALRLLAELPTTKVGGTVDDPLGRPGLAVTFIESEGFSTQFGADDDVAERYTTILDPKTGTLLASDAAIAAEGAEGLTKGTYLYYAAWAPEAGWTDDRPERPRGCRLSDRPIP